MIRYPAAVALVFFTAVTANAGESMVEAVDARPDGAGTYAFSVTVRHADEGWDHYADRWEVLTIGGEVLATRTLHHPHVSEQPFTRSLAGVKVPDGMRRVRVRSHDKVHGYGGRELVVDLDTGATETWNGDGS